jgi:AcrR family transcriptional regulator
VSRKQEIQTAAARLFGERGFAASSVRDIAQAVGLGAASLYNHIGSKDELLSTICFRCANEYLEGMKAIETAPTGALDKIKALIALHIRIALHERRYLRIIRDGVETGSLRQADPYVMYQWILSSLRWLHLQDTRKLRQTEHELTEQLTSLIINGIEA